MPPLHRATATASITGQAVLSEGIPNGGDDSLATEGTRFGVERKENVRRSAYRRPCGRRMSNDRGVNPRGLLDDRLAG